VLMLDQPWQPTLIYPARGIAGLWQPPAGQPPAALARLLGRTRAKLLLALAEPASTAVLAAASARAPAASPSTSPPSATPACSPPIASATRSSTNAPPSASPSPARPGPPPTAGERRAGEGPRWLPCRVAPRPALAARLPLPPLPHRARPSQREPADLETAHRVLEQVVERANRLRGEL
jgi:hypothetical protein